MGVRLSGTLREMYGTDWYSRYEATYSTCCVLFCISMKFVYLNAMQCTVNIAGTSCAKLAWLGESPTFPGTRMLKTS